jgi:hypothetical protein
LSENALKFTYGNVKFQNFPGRTPDPTPRGGKSGREKRGGEGRGRGGEGKGIGKYEGKGQRKGKGWKEEKKEEGNEEEFGPRFSGQIDATAQHQLICLHAWNPPATIKIVRHQVNIER